MRTEHRANPPFCFRAFPQGYVLKHQFLDLYKHFFPFGDTEDFAELLFTVCDSVRGCFVKRESECAVDF